MSRRLSRLAAVLGSLAAAWLVPLDARASIIYQDTAGHAFTGNSYIHVGAYGLSGNTATYVAQASASWTGTPTITWMLFNTRSSSPGPDLFLVQGACAGAAKFYWNIYNSCASPYSGTTPSTINDGHLHTYAVVVNGGNSTTQLYYDGSLVGSATYHAPANNLSIGGDAGGFDWIGTIASFTVYNTALTGTEIAGLSVSTGAPEPLSLAVLGTGLAALGLARRRRHARVPVRRNQAAL